MNHVLDIDMDFFISNIAQCGLDNNRLDSDKYKPWSEESFRDFLENKCCLCTDNPIEGKIITNHHEAFHFWDGLINNGKIKTPFSVTHIDAHSDTGLGDNGYVYLTKELMKYPIHNRRDVLNYDKVTLSNYLSYALACGWIRYVDFVLHDSWDNDIFTLYLKNFNVKERCFEFKGYDESVELVMEIEKMKEGKIAPLSIDPEIPFNLINWKDYETKNRFDYVVFCQSPGFTPETADFMLNVIKDYIIEI